MANKPTIHDSDSIQQEDYVLSEGDLHYLRSIYANLTEFKKLVNETSFGPSLGGEILADNWNWLDCFIDEHTRARQSLSKEQSNG